MKKCLGGLVVCLLSLVALVRCGADEANVDSFPSDLALASPLTAQAARSDLREGDKPPKPTDVSSSDGFHKKKNALGEALKPSDGANSCKFVPLFNAYTAGRADCFGPPLNYTDHEDSPGDSADGSLPTGDLGIWTETNGGGGEACAAAQLNRRVMDIAKQVDSAIFSLASLPCLMAANGVTLLEGETQDLTEVIAAGYSSLSIDLTVSSAQVLVSGNKVTWTLVTVFKGRTVSMRLVHVDLGDSLYQGKLSYTIGHPQGPPPPRRNNCPAGANTDATSIAYQKKSATEMLVEMHSGNFCSSSATPYVSATNFTVDPTKTYDAATQPGGWGNNFNYGLFNFDPATLIGQYKFAWQAGKGDSHARSFSVNVSTARDLSRAATLNATAFFGYGPKMGATGYGDIDRMICNWAGPGNDHTGVTRIQRQVMDNSGTNGTWVSTGANITYAPVNVCQATGTMKCDLPPTTPATTNCSTTDNLVAIGGLTLPNPTKPVDVDVTR